MRFIIYGAGAIGNTLAAALFMRQYEVVLVGNPQHVLSVQSEGLRFITPTGIHTLRMKACNTAAELAPFRPDDVILLTVKSQHTLKCLGQLKGAGAPRETPVFCFQNSIWNEPTASRAFDNVYGAAIMMPVSFLNPGEAEISAKDPWGHMEIGRYPRGTDRVLEEVVDALVKSGFDARANPDVMRAKGAKALTNVMNAFQAITDTRDNGEFGARVKAEAEAVWRAAGIDWEPAEEYSKRNRIVVSAPQPTAPAPAARGGGGGGNKNSSWQSLARRSGSVESEQINGDVATMGRLLGVATPYNEVLWRVSAEMAAKGEKPGKYTQADLEKMASAKD